MRDCGKHSLARKIGSGATMKQSLRTPLILLSLLPFALASQAAAHLAGDGAPRATYDFNAGWRLFVGDPDGAAGIDFDDSSWRPVTLPHAWNEDAAFHVGIRDLPTGVAWYRKRFTLPESDGGKNVYLEFQGVRHAAEVYVNGALVGRHENGVMAFGLDVTVQVRPPPAENV